MDETTDPALLAVALLRTEGAGRVATNRLVERFGSYGVLRATPREQVLTRLPGVPRAEALVARLFEDAFQASLEEAEQELAMLEARRIQVITQHHPAWPRGLGELDRPRRPPVLYVFGDLRLLERPTVAFLARPPLADAAFEAAQSAVRYLLEHRIVPICGLQHGFDTVLCKLAAAAGQPGLGVASAGLARIPHPMRPPAAALARAGGALVSSFPHHHGPYAHDDVERAQLMAAISTAVVFAGAPDDSPEARALSWAAERSRPVFSTTSIQGVPALSDAAGLNRLRDAVAG